MRILTMALALVLFNPSSPAQTLDPGQAEARGRAVLESGHVDIGPRLRDGRWTIQIHDDSATPPVWRSPADTVLRVRDSARQPVPDDPAYAFVGSPPGSEVHVVPQTQQAGVVWIGWNTQDPEVMKAAGRGVTMTLRGVRGPGNLVVYLQAGNLGAPQVLWDSGRSEPQPIFVETNTHTHANWVFGRPGVYLVAVDIAADLADGSTVSGSTVLRFAVGDATDPDEALAASFTAAATPAPAAAEDTDDPGKWWIVLAAGGLLVVVVLGFVARAAAVRRRAERDYR